MEFYRLKRKPDECEIEESSALIFKLSAIYYAYIKSDGNYWETNFFKNDEYIMSGLCSNTIGSCVDYLFDNKIEILEKLYAAES